MRICSLFIARSRIKCPDILSTAAFSVFLSKAEIKQQRKIDKSCVVFVILYSDHLLDKNNDIVQERKRVCDISFDLEPSFDLSKWSNWNSRFVFRFPAQRLQRQPQNNTQKDRIFLKICFIKTSYLEKLKKTSLCKQICKLLTIFVLIDSCIKCHFFFAVELHYNKEKWSHQPGSKI